MYLTKETPKSQDTTTYKAVSIGEDFRLADDNVDAPDIFIRIDVPNKTHKLSVDIEDGLTQTFRPDTEVVLVHVTAKWEDS